MENLELKRMTLLFRDKKNDTLFLSPYYLKTISLKEIVSLNQVVKGRNN